MTAESFEELLGLWLDDELSGEMLDTLVEMVAADPHKLQRLREHLILSDLLSQYEDPLRDPERFLSALQVRAHAAEDTREFVSQVVASVNNEAGKEPRVFRLAGVMAVAAALLFVIGIVYNQVIPRGAEESVSQVAAVDVNDSGVAVLTRVAGLQGTAAMNWHVGQTIPRGLMAWDTGLLQLEFYGGATVVVEGPAKLEILDETRVLCHLGRLRAHVPEPARGFAVLAPSFELVDLGTEFGLSVSDDGAAEVHVFDGKVELYDSPSKRHLTTRRELNAGDALAVDRNGISTRIAARDADFVTPSRLHTMTDVRRAAQLCNWRAFRDQLQHDPRVVVYFPFDRQDGHDRLLVGYGANGTPIEGAIVGCEWSEGRWPGKTSLQFKRPGDRVRVTVPGEYESLTYSTWLRLDGLDRQYNSLLLTDGFDKNGPHWQIRRDGCLVLGLRYSRDFAYSYPTESIFNLFRLGQWVHLATVYDAGQSCVKHYVNGELATREPFKRPAAGLLKIGNATIGNWSVPTTRHRYSSVRNLNGCMDELIVFGQALDDPDIRRIYEAGRP